jgi:uncharacterized protein (DUF3084 family)
VAIMLGIAVAVLVLITMGIKWFTIRQLRDLRASLLEAQTLAMNARNRLKVALNEKAGAERKLSVTGRNNQAAERRITQLEKELLEVQAHADEQAEITRQKLSLAEELKRKSGPIRP